MKSITLVPRLFAALAVLTAVSVATTSAFASCDNLYRSSLMNYRVAEGVTAATGGASTAAAGLFSVAAMQDVAAHGERVFEQEQSGEIWMGLTGVVFGIVVLFEHFSAKDRREALAILEEARAGDGPHLRKQYYEARFEHPSLNFNAFRNAIRMDDDQELFCPRGDSGETVTLLYPNDLREMATNAALSPKLESELHEARPTSPGTPDSPQKPGPAGPQESKSAQ